MRGKKKYCAAVLMALLLGGGMSPLASLAATMDVETDPALETPAFANPAQAQKAANLAEEVASTDTAVKEALQGVEEAQTSLGLAMETNDPDAIAAAKDTLTAAETAYAGTLADATGVASSDISAMRDAGAGWGAIAHELGVHPGMLGLGHTNRERNRERNHLSGNLAAEPSVDGIDQEELAEATARNMESGFSKGHGAGIQSGVHDRGTGRSARGLTAGLNGKSDEEHGGGVSGAGGLGGGSSNAGGNSGDHGGSSNAGGNAGGNSGGSNGHGGSGAGKR